MMEAVARGKAHWLFRAGSNEAFSGKRRPQEDMVTSAVLGSIRLMSSEDRRQAIEVLLGPACFPMVEFPIDNDIEITLWPSLRGAEDRTRVEPDVLLVCSGKTVIVEVKWHAPLSERQLEHQIVAAERNDHNVIAAVMLGEAGVEDSIGETPCFRRTWREVSGAVQRRMREKTARGPFGAWLRIMHDFLHQTDMGRIFDGLKMIEQDPGPIPYRFVKPGHGPWLHSAPRPVMPVNYQFGARE